jgi:hypothetical protein
MRADRLEIERASDHGFKRLVFAFGDVQFRVAKIADAWCEAKSQQVHEGEDMIGESSGVGVVLFNPQIGLVMQQTVEHIG